MKNEITMNSRYFRLYLPLLGLLISLTSSCSRFVRIPQSEYGREDSKEARKWKVKTMGNVYWVSRFTLTDTTMVIEKASTIESGPRGRRLTEFDLPIVLSLDEVSSLERVEFSWVRTAIATTVVVGVAFTVFLHIALENLDFE